MIQFVNAPMPPREVTFTGTNKDFQNLATYIDALRRGEADDPLHEQTETNLEALIQALRGNDVMS